MPYHRDPGEGLDYKLPTPPPITSTIAPLEGQTTENLLDALRKFLEERLKDYQLPVKQEGWNNQPIYEEWFSEAVALGRISAPGFLADPGRRKAYVKAQWYGPTQGQLDPIKEVQAANLRCRYGFSNRAKEAMELTGTDFRDNMQTLRRENEQMTAAGLTGAQESTREEQEQT